jgi:UDP-glucose 4-epimerase
MKILITGANGLIGFYLYRLFKKNGCNDVIGVDNFSNSHKTKDDWGIIPADCGSLDLMNHLCKGVDVIFHCACIPYEGFSNVSPCLITKSVFNPSVTIATAAANNGVKRIYNFSSMARYGNSPNLPFTEETPTKGADPYGIAKIAAEDVFNVMSELYGFEVAHIVPHNVFGNHVRWDDPVRGVINIFISQALRGVPITVHNDGSQRRSFSFVDDVFSFAKDLLSCDIENKEVFNVGPDSDDSYLSVLEIANIVKKETFSKSEIVFVEKLNDVKEARCSSDKVRKKFGWESMVDIHDEIRRMIRYAKSLDLGDFSYDLPIEIESKCPENWKNRSQKSK